MRAVQRTVPFLYVCRISHSDTDDRVIRIIVAPSPLAARSTPPTEAYCHAWHVAPQKTHIKIMP